MYILLKFIYIFFLSSAIASFFKTLMDRIELFFYSPLRKQYSGKEKYENLFLKPSYCYNCNHPIKSLYLIPIVGYILLRGKCKHCKSKIPASLFLWELTGGLTGIYFFYFYSLTGLLYLIISMILIIISKIDFKYFMIDYEILVFLSFSGFLVFYTEERDYINLLIRISFFQAVFWTIFLYGKGKKLGMGDIFLIGSISIFFTFMEILIIMLMGSLLSIVYILFLRKKSNSYAPLGSFLSLSSVLLLFFRHLYIF